MTSFLYALVYLEGVGGYHLTKERKGVELIMRVRMRKIYSRTRNNKI